MILLNQFNKEAECTYKEERYSVRDNGAVMRHCREEKHQRPIDGHWTFGKPNDNNYLRIGSEVIHRIIATAFHGGSPTSQHVVDHIDTNRQNNRPENLRWITKIENILLNPITVKNIIYACGSIEAFLEDPSILQKNYNEANFKWMRQVSREEAEVCLKRMLEWAKSDRFHSGWTLGEWVYKRIPTLKPIELSKYHRSLTPNAVQQNWTIACTFPYYPQEQLDTPVATYAENLRRGEFFCCNEYYNSTVVDFALSNNKNTIWIKCSSSSDIKP